MLLRPIGKAMAEWFWLQEAHGLPTKIFFIDYFNTRPRLKLIIAPHEIHESHLEEIEKKLKRLIYAILPPRKKIFAIGIA